MLLSPVAIAFVGLLALAARAEAFAPALLEQTDPQPIQYRIEGGPLRELAKRFQSNELGVLEKINRADVKHLSRLEKLVMPSEWRDEFEYSPFPLQYAAATAEPKLLIVDQPAQAFAAYESDAWFTGGPRAPDGRPGPRRRAAII